MLKNRDKIKRLIACGIAASIVSVNSFSVLATEKTAEKVNLALNKPTEASSREVQDKWGPENITDGVKDKSSDSAAKPGNSRWASAQEVPQWIYIDFEEATTFDQVDILWDGSYSSDYSLEISDDAETWTEVYSTTEGDGDQDSINFENDVTAQYLRVSCNNSEHEWGNVSIYEVEVYDNEGEVTPPTEEGVNIALNKTTSSSGNETSSLTPDKAVDGNTSSKTSRWASNHFSSGHQWLTVDLGEVSTFDKVRLFWEAANAKVYEIQVSDDNENWTSVHRNEDGQGGVETIELAEKQNARYVRVYCEENNPDVWTTVSLYEVEIYNGEIPPSNNIDEVINGLEVPAINKGDAKLQMPTVPEGFEISFIGADYNQIIGDDLTIHQPLVDTTVVVDFEVTKGNESRETRGIEVSVPGKFAGSLGENTKPEVVPSLREWMGGEGNFEISEATRIVINPAYENELNRTATEFKADYEEIVGSPIEVVYSDNPQRGDFYFTLDCDDTSIGEEGYYMYIADYLKVEATHDTGAFYSTRSILQILQQSGDTIPQGIVRDFPRYENRGYMLDVGRKFFTMDYLEDFMETMSWYKMNDFQIHLNDNYIWVEQEDDIWEEVYSAFRLESDTYPGLAAEDGHYTKEEFKNFIEMSDNHGVEIIPEIDVPAHSLAFTQYDPSLQIGPGKGRDHLDVTKQETYDFVDDLFAEYLGGDDPVFSDQEFHIGTDEYFGTQAQKEAFRAFTDNYLKQVRDDYGRTPRLWGSLTAIPGETPVTSDGVTMNIWNNGWANPRDMIDAGYDIINTNDGELYIVPLAGYYNDYLNTSYLYNNWTPSKIGGEKLPDGHPQLKGAMFATWNDMIWKKDKGITESDVYDRVLPATQVLAEKMWAAPDEDTTYDEFMERAEKVSDVPNSNLDYKVESKTEVVMDYDFEGESVDSIEDLSGNEYHATSTNVTSVDGKEGKGIQLAGGESYIDTPVENKGLDYTVSMWVKKDANGDYSEQILSESNTGVLKACQKETGNVGFSREGIDYSFDYKLPEGEWVELTFVGELNKNTLYVNGEFVETINRANGGKVGTFILPLDRIGSATNSFKGSIDEITVKDGAYKVVDPTAIPQEQMTATASSEHPNVGSEGLAEFAIDGDESTIWHTKWNPVDQLPQHITLELGGTYNVNKFTYMPRQDALNGSITKYELQVSTDGENFTKVTEGEWAADNATKIVKFDAVEATHIRLVANEGHGGFASAAEINVHQEIETPEVSAGTSFLTLPESVNVNENFDVFLGANEIKEGLSAYAAEFTLKYNPEVFDLAEITNGIEGVFVNHKEVEPGTVKIVAASLGTPIESASNLIKATLAPKAASASETIEITSANLGDGEAGKVHELELTSGTIAVNESSQEIIVNPVRNFAATTINKKSVTTTWEAPETTHGLEGYVLYKDGKKVAEIGADETEFTFKGLKRHTIYNFKVAAKYSNGELSSKESITLRTAR